MNHNHTALSDITVLDLCDEKGQLIGKLLGEMGARVLKVEPTAGSRARSIGPFLYDECSSENSLYFWSNNSSKESITLNLESTRGRRIFKQLAKKADVVIESFNPGVLASFGLSFPDLSADNPELIMTSLTGFGQDGPYRDYKTSDLVALAMGGVMHSCGYDDIPGSPPIRPSGGHGFIIGAHYATMGTLMALNWRDMTGEGQYVDASIHEACSCTTEAAMPTYIYNGEVVHRQTARHHGTNPTPRTLCLTSDGKFVNVFAVFTSLNAWRTLVAWMDSEDMAEDLTDEKYLDMATMRTRSGPEVSHAHDVLRRFIKAHTAEHIYRGSQERKLPWGIVRSPEETLDDPHLWDREFFHEIDHPELGKSFIYPGRPYVFNGTPWQTHRAPLLGEHNYKVYVEELGISPTELASLVTDQVI